MGMEVFLKPRWRSCPKSTLMTDIPGMCLLVVGFEALLVQSLKVTLCTGINFWGLMTGQKMPRLILVTENF